MTACEQDPDVGMPFLDTSHWSVTAVVPPPLIGMVGAYNTIQSVAISLPTIQCLQAEMWTTEGVQVDFVAELRGKFKE